MANSSSSVMRTEDPIPKSYGLELSRNRATGEAGSSKQGRSITHSVMSTSVMESTSARSFSQQNVRHVLHTFSATLPWDLDITVVAPVPVSAGDKDAVLSPGSPNSLEVFGWDSAQAPREVSPEGFCVYSSPEAAPTVFDEQEGSIADLELATSSFILEDVEVLEEGVDSGLNQPDQSATSPQGKVHLLRSAP